MTTSEIEGEVLDRASVQSSIRRQLGPARTRAANPTEQGLAELMVDLFRTFAEPISAESGTTAQGRAYADRIRRVRRAEGAFRGPV